MFLSKISNTYYLFFNDELGKRHKVSTKCKAKTEAYKFLRDFKVDEQRKKNPLPSRLLSEFFSEFLSYSKGVHTPKTTQGHFQTAFKEFLRVIGDTYIHKISIREIESFLSIKKEEASEWTARRCYIALSSAFEKAKKWGYIPNNPLREITRPKGREITPVYFTPAEFSTLLSVISDNDFHQLCITAISTGLRLSELTSLQWSDCDFLRKVIMIQNSATYTTKSRRNRVVPMNDGICKIFVSRNEKSNSLFVFSRNGKKLSDWWVSHTFKSYVRRAGLDDKLHFHSLRHTFASWLVQCGTSIYEVQKLLGHGSISVTQIYSHLQPEGLHATVNRISIEGS